MKPIKRPQVAKPKTSYDKTADLMSSDTSEKKPEDMCEIAKTHMMDVLGGDNLPERCFIVYHGKDAYREDDAALIINHSVYNPSSRAGDTPEPAYCVRYLDDEIKWFSMTIPSFAFEQKPKFLRTPRVWAEMMPGTVVRKAWRVKGRK